jgi:hypothetical protein
MSVAGICAITAVVLAIRLRLDAAFVLGALAAVAWFLSYRVQMKQIIAENEPAISDGEDEDDDDLGPID